MKKKVHYRKLEFLFAACGFWPATCRGEKGTNRRKQVTCGNCKRTKLYKSK